LIIKRRGPLGVIFKYGSYILSIEGVEGKELKLWGEVEEKGSYGPFKWRSFKVPTIRGHAYGYVVEIEKIKIVYSGPLHREVPLPNGDVLIMPSGDLWYPDPWEACETFRKGNWKAFIPVALWEPGSNRHFDTFNMIKGLCRSFQRVRSGCEWKINLKGVKRTLVLVSDCTLNKKHRKTGHMDL